MIERSRSPSPSWSHFLRDRGGQQRPSRLPVEPHLDLARQTRLEEVEVARLAHLQIGRARDRRARLDQVGGVELLGAVLALVAARALVAAVGAGALDVAVGQEAAVGERVDLALGDLLDQAGVGEPACEVLRQPVVLGRGRAAEMVEGEAEALRQPRLGRVHRRAVFGDRHPRAGGGELRGRAVLVGGAQEQHLVAPRAPVARVKVGRKLRAHEVAQVLDPVDVGDRGGDQRAGHAGLRSGTRRGVGRSAPRRQCGFRCNRNSLSMNGRSKLTHRGVR